MIDALEWRYATKKFDESKTIDSDKIELLKKAFNLTPTSYGLQPLRLVIVKNQELKNKLFEHSYNQIQVKTASHVLVICIENTVDEKFIRAIFELQKEIRNAKDEIINPFRDFLIKDFGKRSNQNIEEWGKNQAYLALGNLLTVCAAEKIDSCPMEGFVGEAYDDVLNLKEKGISTSIVLPVGYRAKDDKFADFKKVRRPLEETIIEY
ncbi:NAD(P)H-dependent oxidoreductase [Psychroflexus sp. CAK57W]|uniref:NAD(P)H-dependent oxidoreductase n=1 Tax=Psychroflexus curvus TaxID=2873595 RepID=UPI001CC91EA7|nr:NAD(P)H-dependent oxidoreductase [Psychroflexus curvus]MBZ9626520.1 NAD(P)H-dependent oxidoreductase [Psychroflexus curvus]MBZ9786287.1 NAD(P)H-dependent oxidoreductase [Psychroflexus curvus]